jgi:uncharacterized membrane protein YdbT with pleckstrin-like domain
MTMSPRPSGSPPERPITLSHHFHEGPKLRPGEVLVRQVRQSQWTNPMMIVLAAIGIAGYFHGAWLVGSLWLMLGFAFWVWRSFPISYITNERLIQIGFLNRSSTYVETSVDLRRITSVVKIDPIFSKFLGLQRLDVFVAEGRKPKITIRYQHDADAVQHLLSPRRR